MVYMFLFSSKRRHTICLRDWSSYVCSSDLKMFNNYIVDVDSIETYKFSWWGKERSKQLAYLPVTQTLKPKKADSKNFKETKNLYIESDNLAALKILRDSYASRSEERRVGKE